MIAGEEIEIYPLKLKDLDLILKMGNEKTQTESLKELVKKTLRDIMPDVKEEEFDNISISFFQELTEAIMEVNGLKKK